MTFSNIQQAYAELKIHIMPSHIEQINMSIKYEQLIFCGLNTEQHKTLLVHIGPELPTCLSVIKCLSGISTAFHQL